MIISTNTPIITRWIIDSDCEWQRFPYVSTVQNVITSRVNESKQTLCTPRCWCTVAIWTDFRNHIQLSSPFKNKTKKKTTWCERVRLVWLTATRKQIIVLKYNNIALEQTDGILTEKILLLARVFQQKRSAAPPVRGGLPGCNYKLNISEN